jgi:hypothetical protein
MEFWREPSLTVGLAPPLLRSNTLLGHYLVVGIGTGVAPLNHIQVAPATLDYLLTPLF